MDLTDFIRSCEEDGQSDALSKYLKRKAWVEGRPLTGLFELTPRCTLDCRMCYVHLSDAQMRREELTTDEWISIIDDACDAGMLYATLTGGECLLYPGFRRIYEHLQERGVLVTLLTNGTLLDEGTVAWLASRKPQRVQITVYGSSPAGYENVTGHAGAFYKVDQAIDLLREAGIALDIAVTVTRQMMPDFEETLRYLIGKGLTHYKVNPCPFDAREETEREFDDYAPSLDEQVEVFRVQKRLYYERYGGGEVHETVIANPDTSVLPSRGIVCSAGRNSFSVNWKGKMLPCNVFDFAGGHPLKDGFTNAWLEMNRRCVDYVNPVECVDCDYYHVCRFCPAGHYMRMGEGHADPAVCAEGKRMVQEKIRILRS